nr:YdcF family protein [uncultured Rhodoferax sp.]
MFIFSKIVGWFTQPLTWLLLGMALAWVLSAKRPALARRALAAGVLLLALSGWQPLPEILFRHLESRYPEFAPSADLTGYAGVIVLGGGTESGRLQQSHLQPLINDGGERLAVSAALALRHSALPLIYTGGEGDPAGGGPSEAARAQQFYASFRIPAAQVRYEAESRNTYENAIFTAKLPGVNRHERWLLMTSAWHMPRAMATFQKAGWNVTAYPVDYRAEDTTVWTRYSLRAGVSDWQLVLNELVGLVAYRLSGRL